MKAIQLTAVSLVAAASVMARPAAAAIGATNPPAARLANAPPDGANGVPADQAGEAAKSSEAPQATRAPNSIYIEGLGPGFLYSINYERLVLEDVGVRAGFSYVSLSASASSGGQSASASASLTTIPVTVSYLGVGSPKHMLELGGGMSFAFAGGSASGAGFNASGSGMTVLPDVMIGYRSHPVDGAGFQFRVGAMAFAGKGLGFNVSDPQAFGVLPWLYTSLGASF